MYKLKLSCRYENNLVDWYKNNSIDIITHSFHPYRSNNKEKFQDRILSFVVHNGVACVVCMREEVEMMCKSKWITVVFFVEGMEKIPGLLVMV